MIVVTGGTKGIGEAIIKRFSEDKQDIITCSRNHQDLMRLRKEIENVYHNRVHVFTADLSIKNQRNNFIIYITQKFNQPIELLVNNAGVFIPGEIHKEANGIFEKMMETNLYSIYDITRAVLPQMIQRKRGHIINVCSVASTKIYSKGSSYCISKHALYAFSKCLREELKAYSIRVSTILPGATLTESWRGINIPDKRFIQPKDIAETIYYCYHLPSTALIEEVIIRPQLGDI